MQRVVIMGAAGRDFHNFNVYFRGNEEYKVVAFTATQIPDITGRQYPPELAGEFYPEGIPIRPEDNLSQIIEEQDVDLVVFSYSDVPHQYVMERSAKVNAAGADFMLLGPESTMISSETPLVAITAVRTGCGKSQTTRKVTDLLRDRGYQVVVIRHPMPYGDLAQQRCQRFETLQDLDRHECTIEEREEYEPHIDRGNIVYAGVDYAEILREAEKEADVIVWDGGNNDFPFYRPDLNLVLTDPLRSGHERTYYPGSVTLRLADAAIINKVETASGDQVNQLRQNINEIKPQIPIIEAASPISVEHPETISGKEVLVIEDGPTLTHGEMDFGAGTIAARKYGAKAILDPKPHAVGSLANTFEQYPSLSNLLPAMGYGRKQIEDLHQTIKRTDPEAVIIGTPIDLRKVIDFEIPSTRVKYELQEIGKPDLETIIDNTEVFGT